MQNLQVFDFEGSSIQFEIVDGRIMANATEMFKVNNARLDHWKSSEATSRYIQAVTRNLGIGENEIIISKKGGDTQGTWIHEKLILNAARYISVDFELWCDDKIAELLRTGAASIKPSLPNFSNPAEAARAWANEFEQKTLAEAKVLELKPKAEFYDAVVGSDDTVDIGTVAKVLNFKGIGRTKLFQILRDEKVLMQTNRPYQQYCDKEWFRVIETTYSKPDGSQHIYFKTVVFQKGVEGIRKILTNKQ